MVKNILIAPNAFKNNLSAAEAASAIAKGFLQSKLNCTCTCFPVGDGGDGTANLIIEKFNGKMVAVKVSDPLGREISASFGLIDNGKTAVIEMANASGLRLLNATELNPLKASTYGTGEMIKYALDKGVDHIIIGMGGSATVDGGMGILQALGVQFIDAKGNDLIDLPKNLSQLYTIDLSKIDQRIFTCAITILCDVDNYLLGPSGSAAVFGPQKGATAEGVIKLEASLNTFRNIVLKHTGKDIGLTKYGGAAGGAAAGLNAILNATLVPGAAYFLKLTKFEDSLLKADIVITGEGSIDEQTLQGKAPFAVAEMAKNKGLPVIGLAGKIPPENNEQLAKYFDMLLAINNGPTDVNDAIKNTGADLTRVSAQIGNLLASF